MLSIFSRSSGRFCDRVSRRDALRIGALGVGCLLAKELSRAGSRVPDHVGLYTTYVGFNNNLQVDFAAFLGAAHEPINILNKLARDDLAPPTLLCDRDHRDRESLRDALASGFYKGRERDATAASHRTAYRRVRNLMQNLVKTTGDKLAAALAKLPDRSQQIEEAVQTVWSRTPSPEEIELLTAYLDQRQTPLAESRQQMIWALVNSPQFRFNH